MSKRGPRPPSDRSVKRRRTIAPPPEEGLDEIQPAETQPSNPRSSASSASQAAAAAKRPRPNIDFDFADDEDRTARTQSQQPARTRPSSRRASSRSRSGKNGAATRASDDHSATNGVRSLRAGRDGDNDSDRDAANDDDDGDEGFEAEGKQEKEEDEEDEDFSEIQPAQPQPRSRRLANGHAHSDGHAEEENELETEDAVQQTQAEIARMRRSAGSGFSKCGILQSVTLERFMSHAHFTIKIGPNVSIINGANGSGKSAIVAALQIGLGAKPGQTERGTKLEDLIQHGKDSATVTIRILNHLPDDNTSDFTYKHDVFGDIITIERRLYRGKAAQWALKTKGNRNIKLPQGQTVHREVMEIVDYFGFNVKNPVSILTQTKSKQFLGNSKPSDHYQLYSEATLLKPLENELKHTIAVTSDVKRLLASHQRRRPAAEKQLQKLENEHRNAQEMRGIDEKVKEARALWAWSQVEHNEQQVRECEEKTETLFKPEAEKCRTAHKKQEKALAESRAHETELNAAAAEAKNDAAIKKESYKKVLISKKTCEDSIIRKKRKIEELTSDVHRVNHYIAQAEAEKEKARELHFKGQEQKSRLLEQFKAYDEEENKYKQKMEAIREEKKQNEEEIRTASEEKRIADNECARTEREYEGRYRELTHLERNASTSNSIIRFGETVAGLCRAIQQNAHKFRDAPIGPLGHYISLKDESWASAVEAAVGRNLMMFLVSNSNDSRTLQKLIPRGVRGPRPNIIVMSNLNNRRYELTPDKQPELNGEGQRIVDVLEFQHDAVFNAMVDNANIDQHVLINDGYDVRDLGWSGARNILRTWNKRCEQAYERGGSKTFRSGAKRNQAQYLVKDMRPLVQRRRDELSELEGKRAEVAKAARDCELRLRQLRDKTTHASTELESCRRAIQATVERRNRIEAQLNSAENAFDPSPFEQRISQYGEQKTEHEAQKSKCTADLVTLKEQLNESSQAIEQEKAALKAAREKEIEADEKVDDALDTVADARHRLKSTKTRCDEAEAKLQKAEDGLVLAKRNVADKTANAMEFGPRPDGSNLREKPLQAVERELRALLARKESEQQKRGGKSVEDIERDYLTAEKTMLEIKRKEDRILHYVEALNKGIKTRDKKLATLGRTTRMLVRAYFREFLQKRNHDGNIEFNTETEELTITTKMASHQRADGERHTTADLRSLSGGERSYTTLCFMVALSEVTFNPTRVMDEIDVFQDESNRRASFKLLVQFFVKYLAHRQVIIITPHSLPDINPSPAVRIVKLQAPRDGGCASETGGSQTRIDQFMGSEE